MGCGDSKLILIQVSCDSIHINIINIVYQLAAIPYLTSLGDLIGSSLLFGAFAFLRAVGHGYEGRDTSVASELLAAPFDHYLRAIGQTKV